MTYHWWHWLIGAIGLTGAGFLFREALVGAAQAIGGWAVDRLKEWREKKQKEKLPMNGDKYITKAVCEIKHKALEDRIDHQDAQAEGNDAGIRTEFKELRTYVESAIYGNRQIDEQKWQVILKMEREIGGISGTVQGMATTVTTLVQDMTSIKKKMRIDGGP